VYGPERRRDRELPDCVDHAQPNRHAAKIAIRRRFLGSFGAFRHCLVAEAREYQVGYPPNVDFRYHAERLRGGTSIYGQCPQLRKSASFVGNVEPQSNQDLVLTTTPEAPALTQRDICPKWQTAPCQRGRSF
jgi:hypothetical protein